MDYERRLEKKRNKMGKLKEKYENDLNERNDIVKLLKEEIDLKLEEV
jgi:hypothetical protein